VLAYAGWRMHQREPRPVAEPDQALQAPWRWPPPELDWRSLPVVEPLSVTGATGW
jgi:flagellar biosynthesis protein FlhA